MIRIIIDIENHGDKLATKEAVAMALEQFGLEEGANSDPKHFVVEKAFVGDGI